MRKIKSKYIIKSIQSYILDDDNIIYNLIKYSKSLQKKFGKKITNYQEKHLKNRIDFKKYLTDYDLPENKLKLQKILLEYQIYKNDFSNIALIYFEKYFNDINNNKYINHNLLDISLNSPYFTIFSKSTIFENFNIKIDDSNIKEDKSTNICTLKFDKLNKNNSKYTSISCYCNDKDDINYLKNMNINFNQIKALKLSLFQNNENLDSFLNDLFSFNNIDKKLIYLNLNLAEYKINMNSKLFENINKLKLLQYLTLFNFIFDDFELKLNNLKYIYLNKCKSI